MLERILLVALTVMTAGCTTLHIEEEVGDQPESWGAYIDRSHNDCDGLVGRYDAHGTARLGSGADHAATLNDVFFYEKSNVPAQASSFSVVKNDGDIVIDVTGEFRKDVECGDIHNTCSQKNCSHAHSASFFSSKTESYRMIFWPCGRGFEKKESANERGPR